MKDKLVALLLLAAFSLCYSVSTGIPAPAIPPDLRDAPGELSDDLLDRIQPIEGLEVPAPAFVENAPGMAKAPAAGAAAPCKGEKDTEKIREFLWRLADLEKQIGYDSMLRSYSTVDVTEHAITTDDESFMTMVPKPLPTDHYPYDQIANNSGLFLPDGVRYNETICAGPGVDEVDVRWYLHGYLSTRLSAAAKPLVGWIYNTGLGYGKTEEGKHNAAVNSRSLNYGIEMKNKAQDLEAFAKAVLGSLGADPSPPADPGYKKWQKYSPLSAEEVRREALKIAAALAGAMRSGADADLLLAEAGRVRFEQVNKGRFRVEGKITDKQARGQLYYKLTRFIYPKTLDGGF